MKQTKKRIEDVFHGIFLGCGLLSVFFVVGISAYLIISGVPAIKEIGLVDFMLGQLWHRYSPGFACGLVSFEICRP